MHITFRGIEFDSACEAMQHADDTGGKPITLANRFFAVSRAEADRLQDEGISFAILCDREMPDGTYRLVTIPVN